MATANSHVMERLKNVMLSDANNSMDTLIKVLKSDIFCLLSEYMHPLAESLKVGFEIDADGFIGISINVLADRLIDAGYIID